MNNFKGMTTDEIELLVAACNSAAFGVYSADRAVHDRDDISQEGLIWLMTTRRGGNLLRRADKQDAEERHSYLVQALTQEMQRLVDSAESEKVEAEARLKRAGQIFYTPEDVRRVILVALDPEGTIGMSSTKSELDPQVGIQKINAENDWSVMVIDVRRAFASASPATRKVIHDWHGNPASWMRDQYGARWGNLLFSACEEIAARCNGEDVD